MTVTVFAENKQRLLNKATHYQNEAYGYLKMIEDGCMMDNSHNRWHVANLYSLARASLFLALYLKD